MRRSLFLILLLAALSLAQDRGTITGTVTDPSGAAIPDAKVVIKNPATNLTQEVSTGADGTYSVLYLPAGTYTVQVEKTGFQTSQANEVRVSVNTSTRVDVQLPVGETQQVVEVSAQAQLLQTDRTDLGKVISGKAIMDLPLFLGGGLRNNLAFVNLVPGVQGDPGNPRIGGGLLAGASLMLDGAESNSERRNDRWLQFSQRRSSRGIQSTDGKLLRGIRPHVEWRRELHEQIGNQRTARLSFLLQSE